MKEGGAVPARQKTAQTSTHPLLLRSPTRFQPRPGYLSLLLTGDAVSVKKEVKQGK